MPDDNDEVGPDGGARGEREVSENEQTLSDSDQSSADVDQTASDVDASSAERDERASARDQRAADSDQSWADDAAGQPSPGGVEHWADTRRARAQTSLERDVSSQARQEVTRVRDANADARDRDADVRDALADERDRLAASLDAELDRLERAEAGSEEGAAALADRRSAAAARQRAAVARQLAAVERAQAATDRRRGAADRAAARAALAAEGVDGLTGALRRQTGLQALERELHRTRRTGEQLTVAFVDVDGLKAVNDTYGHAAGDTLLCAVARCITRALRRYDLVLRYGGDEFVCAFSGQDERGAESRFARIRADLAKEHEGATISVGFAQARDKDTAEQLAARADAAMMDSPQRRAKRFAARPDS